MSFFRLPRMWNFQMERYGLFRGCWSVSEANLWSLSLTRLAVWDGCYHAKGWFRPTTFQGVMALLRVAKPLATKKRTTPLWSSCLRCARTFIIFFFVFFFIMALGNIFWKLCVGLFFTHYIVGTTIPVLPYVYINVHYNIKQEDPLRSYSLVSAIVCFLF